jgi:hypothetical protein
LKQLRDERCDFIGIVQVKHGQMGLHRVIGSKGNNIRIVRKNGRINVRCPSHFDAWNISFALETFDDDQIARCQFTQQLVQSCGPLRCFSEQGPP